MRIALVLALIVCTIGVSSALTLKVPAKVLPNEEFDITIYVNSTVSGVVLKIPEGFKVVNCSQPYRIYGNELAIAVINANECSCKLKAAKEGVFVIEGKWIDMLKNRSCEIKQQVVVAKTNVTPKIEVTPTPTPTLTETPKILKTPKTPGFGVTLAVVSILIALWRCLR